MIPPPDDPTAVVERTRHHCYREVVEHREDGEVVRTEAFLCGQLGPPCCQCGAVSTVLCDFPLGEENRTCDRPLCERCAPTIGNDKNFCAEHTAAGAGPNMLLFKRPIPTVEQLHDDFQRAIQKRKPRLPKAPPPERRHRVMRQGADGSSVQVTGWMGEWAAHKYAKALGNPAGYYVESWDDFVRWHRKTYPLAPKRRPKKP